MLESLKVKDITIEWLGHASFRIKSKRTVIYIDPFILDENPDKADFILITHEHYDHCDNSKVQQLTKADTKIIAPPSCISKLRKEFKMINPGEEINESGVKISAMLSYNIKKPFHQKGTGLGYIIDINNIRIYHSGDTDQIPEMRKLSDENITVALLPIGGTYTMDEKEAAEAVKVINPLMVVPMHYGQTEQITLEADTEKFKELVGDSSDLKVLKRKALD